MEKTTESGAGASAWPQGIYAITLFVESLEDTKQFYREVFGLPVVFEDANSAVFKFGTTLVNLLKTTAAGTLIEPAAVASREVGSRQVFTIEVEDVDSNVCGAEQTRSGAPERPDGSAVGHPNGQLPRPRRPHLGDREIAGDRPASTGCAPAS